MPNQDLRFRRKVVTTGEPQPKNRLAIILSIAAAAVILPALGYTALHPANVSNTVRQIARHLPLQVKDIHIAVVAARATPVPSPTATSSLPSPTPKPTVTTTAQALQAEHLAHLKRAHELALREAARKKKLAALQTASVVSGSNAVAGSASQNTAANPNTPTRNTAQNTNAANNASATTVSTPTPTPVQVAAAAAPQVPLSEATPVYAPEIVVDARFTRQIRPDYPDVAREEGAQGTAVVLAVIGPNGNVLSARIDQSTGNRLLDSAALTAARGSGFEPPKVNGKPATETYRLMYTFSL